MNWKDYYIKMRELLYYIRENDNDDSEGSIEDTHLDFMEDIYSNLSDEEVKRINSIKE